MTYIYLSPGARADRVMPLPQDDRDEDPNGVDRARREAEEATKPPFCDLVRARSIVGRSMDVDAMFARANVPWKA